MKSLVAIVAKELRYRNLPPSPSGATSYYEMIMKNGNQIEKPQRGDIFHRKHLDAKAIFSFFRMETELLSKERKIRKQHS